MIKDIEKNHHEFAFCYNCGKRTNTESDRGYVWKRPDGSDRYAQCQKCGDELTLAMVRLRERLERDFPRDDRRY